MDEISNRTLAILLIGAIVISLGGTLISLNRLGRIKTVSFPGITGMAVNQTLGNVSLEVTDVTWINFSIWQCDFGDGFVTGSATCGMNSTGWINTTGGGQCSTDFTGCTNALEIRNIGNHNVTLNITMASGSTTFLGASGRFYWKMVNGTNGTTGTNNGCFGGTAGGAYPTEWTEQAGDGNINESCEELTFAGGNNAVHMDIKVVFTQDLAAGFTSNLITAEGISK